MSDPQPLAQTHPVEVWAALVGACSIILALVTVLYNRLNRDIKDCNTRLDNGQKAFEDIKISQGRMEERLKMIDADFNAANEELDRLDNADRGMDGRLKTIEVEHHNCIARRMALRGKTQEEL